MIESRRTRTEIDHCEVSIADLMSDSLFVPRLVSPLNFRALSICFSVYLSTIKIYFIKIMCHYRGTVITTRGVCGKNRQLNVEIRTFKYKIGIYIIICNSLSR